MQLTLSMPFKPMFLRTNVHQCRIQSGLNDKLFFYPDDSHFSCILPSLICCCEMLALRMWLKLSFSSVKTEPSEVNVEDLFFSFGPFFFFWWGFSLNNSVHIIVSHITYLAFNAQTWTNVDQHAAHLSFRLLLDLD